MASEHSDADRTNIDGLCQATGGGPYQSKGCWIGMKTELWVDASPVDYHAWSADRDQSGPCVWQYLNRFPGLWDDQSCDFTLPYVCKLQVGGNTAGATKTALVP